MRGSYHSQDNFRNGTETTPYRHHRNATGTKSGGARPRSPSHAAKNKTPEDRVCEFGWMLTQRDGRLVCRACNLNLDHTRRSTIVEHLRSRKHQRFLEESDFEVLNTEAAATVVPPIVMMEICEEENSQSNTQSSSDRRSHQSSPTPSMIGPYLLKKETHCTTILDQLLRDDTFSDVTLTAEGHSIRAHKIVLCLASAYFRQVLSKESNVQNVIVFRDVKFAELKNLINFIYTGEATVDAADLESFMKTAEMLEVTSLCDGQRNFPKNLLPRAKETEIEKVPSSTSSKTTFPAVKRSHASSSAANNGSPPTKSRKTEGKDSSKRPSVVHPHPSTSGGGGGTSSLSNSIIESSSTIIKTEPMSEDSVADEEYELKIGADVSFESLTRSPPPPSLAIASHVSAELCENQTSASDQLSSSSTSLEKVPVGKCPFCPSTQPTRNGSELTKHLYTHHQEKTVFCCENCSRVFLKKGSFEAHKDDCLR